MARTGDRRGDDLNGWKRLAQESFLFSALVIIAIAVVRWGGWWRVEKVKWLGVHNFSPHSVSQLTNYCLGANILRLDLRGVRDQAEQDPWVKQVRVCRDLWSRSIVFIIDEREPVARVQLEGGNTVWVDAEGVVLGPAFLDGVNVVGALGVNGRVPKQVVVAALAASQADPSLFFVFDVSNPECVVARKEGGPKVLCGPAEHLHRAITILEHLVREFDLSQYREVDLRFGDEVILKPK